MAITTSAELLTALQNWLARTDLSSRCPEFVALCEAKLKRDIKGALDQETKSTSFSINAEYVNVPTDFQTVRSMFSTAGGARYGLDYMTERQMTERFGANTGIPRYYCVVGSQFRFAPVPDTTYTATLVYTITFTALAGGTDTNWILTKHPDLYLYGALTEAEGFLQDDPRLPVWKQGYLDAIASVNGRNARNRWSGNLQIKTDVTGCR